MMELFWKINQRLLVINYFRKNALSQKFDLVLNTFLQYIECCSFHSMRKKSEIALQLIFEQLDKNFHKITS